MSLFSDLKPKAHLSSNIFDRSRSETFSTKLGILTPVFVEHTVPKGKYKINVSDLVYPSTMAKANFSAITQNIEFAFVPYSQLWNRFNKFYYGRGEVMRSENVQPQQNVTQPYYTPVIDIYTVVRECVLMCVKWEWFDGVRRYNETLASPNDLSDLWSWAETIGLLLPASTDWHTTKFIDVHGRFCGYDILRNIDMLGYGNFIPVVNYFIYEATEQTILDFTVNPTAANIAVVEAALDNLFSSSIESTMPDSTVYVNPFACMAYVKFFNDYFKNREYDDYDYSYLFNADWVQGNSTTSYLSALNICNLLKPYYRQYKRDMFTGSYPNPQFGNVSVAGLENPSTITSNFTPSAATQVYVLSSSQNLNVGSSSGTTRDKWTINSSVSALAIRQAEALQRWKERIMRAGRRLEDLQQAIFGVGSKYLADEYVDYLGSFASSVNINPVAATAETGSLSNGDLTNVGDLGASTVGSISMGEQKEIEFEAYDFGVIIGLMYFLPDAKYENFGIDAHNIKTIPERYYRPDFQNLGLDSVPSYLASVQGSFDITGATNLGFLSRYYEYKTAVSKVHGEFYGSSLVMPTSESGHFQNLPLPNSFGAFSDYVATRNAYDIAAGDLRMLYVAPWDADRLFVQSDRPSPKFDHFVVEITFRAKEVLPMSVQGLPIAVM